MKIKKLKLDNFVKFTDFEIEFDGKITNLVGINGSGKTTIGLTAIWACLKGIAQQGSNDPLIGERYRFIGDSKPTADIELTLIDEDRNAEIKIRNHISKTANKITFNAPDGYEIDNAWINNLFSVAFMSAKNFTSRSSKEQALLLGIDTKRFDEHVAKLKQDYTYINRKITAAGELTSVEKVEKVSIGELLAEKDKIDAFNNKQLKQKTKIEHEKSMIEDQQMKITTLENSIRAYTDEVAERNNAILALKREIVSTIIERQKDTSEIIEKINNAEQTNQKASEYIAYAEKKAERDAAKSELDSNKRDQDKVMQERLEYIKSFDFDFKNLSVSEKGELLVNDRPLKEQYFSKGQLEIIVAKLHAAKNPGLKVRFIDDFDLLDENNQERIIESLLDSGFQIITAQVGDDAKAKENTVLLRECKQIKE